MHRVAENAIEDLEFDETRLAVVGGGRLSILSVDVNHLGGFATTLLETRNSTSIKMCSNTY